MSTPMTQEEKDWIDNSDYEALLSRWRFAPVGDHMFSGETGDYYSKSLSTRRNANPDLHVEISKKIGWRLF